MQTVRLLLSATLLSALALPVEARSTFDTSDVNGGGSAELQPVLQCVPYARRVTGIQIYGDAHTWWGQADGRYRRGSMPQVGAVMAVQPHGNSRLGHVAAVSRVLDSRTILLRHANWSSPGEIEDNVKAVDVSPENDWSEVRIWYAPTQSLGARHWPLYGFIYNDRTGKSGAGTTRIARSSDPIGDIIAGLYRR